MRRLVSILGLSIALLAPFAVVAPAHAFVPPRAWQARALGIAQYVWNPPCGALSMTFDDPTGVMLSATGVTTDPSAPLDAKGANASGWTALGDCHMHINRDEHWLGYPDFCETVLHEAGHAAGFGHRRKGIMSPFNSITLGEEWHGHHHMTVWQGVDIRCMPGEHAGQG